MWITYSVGGYEVDYVIQHLFTGMDYSFGIHCKQIQMIGSQVCHYHLQPVKNKIEILSKI